MGSYGHITVAGIYNVTQNTYSLDEAALAWVEAENIMEIRSLISEWFEAIEAGIADKRYLDPRGPTVSLEDAEKMIGEIDDDFNIEKNRWVGLEVQAGPDFSRLVPHAKIAFVQQILMTIKTLDQLEKEVHIRQKMGEQIPPSAFAPKQLPLDPSEQQHPNNYWDYMG